MGSVARALAVVALAAACRDRPTTTATTTTATPTPTPTPTPTATATATPAATPRFSSGPWGIAHAPTSLAPPRSVILYLHGMWASPEDSCSFFVDAAAPHGFLVCPRGNAPLGAGHMWSGDYSAVLPRLRAALDAADALAPGVLDRTRGGTLVGFSNGASFALKIALAEEGRWTGLVLMSMDLAPDAERLKRAGIKRVVFAAGDFDGSRFSLERAAKAMNAAGLESRYTSLGPVGHHFANDMVAKMTAAIAWVRE